MTFPVNPESVKNFVRHTLGCSCPDSVFESQDIDREVALKDIKKFKKLVIGEKLLIYLIDIDSAADWPSMIAQLISAGKSERDLRSLNRFRLVLGTEDIESVQDEADRILEGMYGQDAKIHLHVVTSSELEKIV
ncbi:MAG: hypothetical protein EP297_14900 [Gammaproteobacteria bacterium]|nr:MAG: hypothetical protein EP297_14900 [Gammaproteobacteria bacterium]